MRRRNGLLLAALVAAIVAVLFWVFQPIVKVSDISKVRAPTHR